MHPVVHIDQRPRLGRLAPRLDHCAGFVHHDLGTRGQLLPMKGGLHQPPLPRPEVPFTGQQALALQGRYRFQQQPFAVIVRVLAQDIVHRLRVTDEIDGMRQGSQPHDIAKLRAESEIFRQSTLPHPAQAVPERHAARARGLRERRATGHGSPFLWAVWSF